MVYFDHKTRDGGKGFWGGVVVLVIMGLFVLWMLKFLIREIHRWLISDAGVVIRDDKVYFGIPRAESWWYPLLVLHKAEISLASIKSTGFSSSSNSTLTIEGGEEKVEIPAKTFAVAGYTLDRNIRTQENSSLKPVEPKHFWSTSLVIRLVMIILGFIIFAIGCLLVTVAPPDNKIPGLIAIPGVGLLCLGFYFYRGCIVIDERGIFHERGGKLSLISWDVLKEGSVKVSTEFWLWSTLRILSHSTITKKPAVDIRLNRILGLGFPLTEIKEAIESELRTRK